MCIKSSHTTNIYIYIIYIYIYIYIYIKGDKTDLGNYRPVSLTSLVCKTLERQIMKYLEMNEILAEVQYEFRSNRSCEPQLFLTIDDLTRALDDKL